MRLGLTSERSDGSNAEIACLQKFFAVIYCKVNPVLCFLCLKTYIDSANCAIWWRPKRPNATR